MIYLILSFLLGAAVGALAYRKNAAKVSKIEAKGKAALDALKNR